MRVKGGYTYIISNINRSMLYTGVTNNLYRRICEHKKKQGSIFASKYNCVDLLYYEFHNDIITAIHREKRIKKLNRVIKNQIIQNFNPEWKDLFGSIEDMQ